MTVIDASVWISRALPRDAHYEVTSAWASAYSATDSLIAVPSLFLVEFGASLARRTSSNDLAREGIARVEHDPLFEIVDMDRGLVIDAAELAVSLRIRGADAIYVALAKRLVVPLITWDDEQRSRARHLIDALSPAEALERLTESSLGPAS